MPTIRRPDRAEVRVFLRQWAWITITLSMLVLVWNFRHEILALRIPATATTPEILWTGIGLLALLMNLWLLWDAVRDMRALATSGRNGARRIVARTSAVVQFGLAAPQGIAVLLGVIAMLAPTRNPNSATTRATVIIIAGLILNQVIALAVALYSRWRRVRLLAYLNDHEEHAATIGLQLTRIDGHTTDTNATVHAIDDRISAKIARSEDRLDRAEAREEARDQRMADAAEKVAQATQRTDDRRDERERSHH